MIDYVITYLILSLLAVLPHAPHASAPTREWAAACVGRGDTYVEFRKREPRREEKIEALCVPQSDLINIDIDTVRVWR